MANELYVQNVEQRLLRLEGAVRQLQQDMDDLSEEYDTETGQTIATDADVDEITSPSAKKAAKSGKVQSRPVIA